ncbi:YtpR family tRNA-binding protein [Lacticaseibacillus parakribbianus]|uniref:YtpR family tRNA-binding protein n=1 Tax=Lacticaseibacillus parakribbianus TaxID=2970927 RepID=UPI0021CAE8F3|nr:DUF4479 and tRNA-binding domain-containing protein [Lacticaseibacillus parakribbianus]
MLITSVNQLAWGDTLVAVLGPDTAAQTTRTAEDIVGIYDETGAALGFNFFHASQWVGPLAQAGQVFLTEAQVAALNEALQQAGLEGTLAVDGSHLVIGKIVGFEPHPDSDHLHITQVDLGDRTEQIVCGAPNAALGQTVVAALPGTMMPDGKLIWPGELRGVASAGMLCAARELAIPGAPTQRGILIMPDDLAAGTPYDAALAAQVVAAQQH